MSEGKLYAVKNDEGKYWDFEDQDGFWELNTVTLATVAGEEGAKCVAHDHGGHVVTFIEEPEKVVLTKEQAKIVEDARDEEYPENYICNNSCVGTSGEEELLMNAYVNGYTVANEKKYLVYKALGGKQKHELFAQAYRPAIFPDTITWSVGERRAPKTGVSAQFSEAEIEHYGLQDCEKEEVTDDGIR
ncbi:DUF1642 domain-containing protein [Lacticaseibacillus casei]|uniref:DUF1642 domain-containing protein n=1 Tax=Lacticaseibacillus casei TaxID=1582 RepID=UPI0014193FD3|nr:DUF1642 domain-containing protein [Lacticaseibacillus casei]NIG83992.1 DUF1642 domain-containing protein [Lacticaseibacillus casei]